MGNKKPIVYIDKSHFDTVFKAYVFDILKANFFNTHSPEERLAKFGPFVNLYTYTDNIDEADFAMLPMAWNYYIDHHKKKLAEDFINYCKSKNKKVISYLAYDFGVTPTIKDIYVFRASGYQSRRLKHQFACPFFLNDYLKIKYNTENITVREKGTKAVVGFCGQAKVNAPTNAWHLFNIAVNNIKYYTHLKHWEPQVLYPPVLRRQKALSYLENSELVETNFIKRTAYRAGANTETERKKTTDEYYDNLMHSDYIVCIRGGGNFSTRFYETMMMGRIPLFINTDSILPFDNIIDWKKHTVWVEEKDMKYMPQILADFHSQIHPDDFKQMQLDNRQIWVNHLSNYGIFDTIATMVMA
ncbi:MAG: exostosin family protein [Bacteroidota bacterium]|nr:exostosin family protein [Bacteroidota bacterium]